jgi:hypothetical protein
LLLIKSPFFVAGTWYRFRGCVHIAQALLPAVSCISWKIDGLAVHILDGGLEMHLFPGLELSNDIDTLIHEGLCTGGGGASGSGSFESLIDRIRFRGKPKVVDLTNARRLADKVPFPPWCCA